DRMTRVTTAVTVLLLLVLAVPGTVGIGLAAQIPDYFGDEWVAFVCLTATPPGSGPTTVLLQLNFDKLSFGGIPLDRADRLYAYLTNNLGILSPVIGPNPQKTCTLTPSQVTVQFPGKTALDAAQLVSPSFQQLGFARYVILDAFLNF